MVVGNLSCRRYEKECDGTEHDQEAEQKSPNSSSPHDFLPGDDTLTYGGGALVVPPCAPLDYLQEFA